jgi:hypothetical protein
LSISQENNNTIEASFAIEAVPALGHYRLRLLELIHQMIKINKNSVFDILGGSKIFSKISELLLVYRWNNFLHLKV